MRKTGLFLAAAFFFLTGCGADVSGRETIPSDMINSTSSDTESETSDGVGGIYYKKESEMSVMYAYNPDAQYGKEADSLYYNGSIYTCTDVYKVNEENIDLNSALGEKIGVVYGNHGFYWSTDSEKLNQSTDEGMLYRVKGCDEDYKVCIVWQENNGTAQNTETMLRMIVCVKLNDITLISGNDLYTDRMHLENSVAVSGDGGFYWGKNDFDWEKHETYSMKDSVIQEFLTALNEAAFIPEDESEDLELDKKGSCFAVFKDSTGMQQALALYDGGYVVPYYGGHIVAQMDEEVCDRMMKHIKGYDK